MNCKSNNLIYVKACNGCGEHYIDQTRENSARQWGYLDNKLMTPVPYAVSNHLET